MSFQTRLPQPPPDGDAWTLGPDCVSIFDDTKQDWSQDNNNISTRVHDNGWTITGQIQEDYYSWVLEFVAFHPQYGMVWGNIDQEILATSEEAWLMFSREFPAEPFDFGCI